MGQHKDSGDPALALAEECAEVIQVIAKKYRFDGDWNEIPGRNLLTRWEHLVAEMDDVIYQWTRLKTKVICELTGTDMNNTDPIDGLDPKVLGKIDLTTGEPTHHACDKCGKLVPTYFGADTRAMLQAYNAETIQVCEDCLFDILHADDKDTPIITL